MQGTQIAFEFHLSFQKMRKHQRIVFFSLLTEFFRGFFVLYWLDEYTRILSQLLKKVVSTHLAFEKGDAPSSGL